MSGCRLAAGWWLLAWSALASALASAAVPEPAEHPHAPRHGGLFGDAEDLYHYEVLINVEGNLMLYVNDEHNQPLDTRTLQARYALMSSPGAPIPFQPTADGAALVAPLTPGAPNPVPLTVEVWKKDRWVAMEFHVPLTTPVITDGADGA